MRSCVLGGSRRRGEQSPRASRARVGVHRSGWNSRVGVPAQLCLRDAESLTVPKLKLSLTKPHAGASQSLASLGETCC